MKRAIVLAAFIAAFCASGETVRMASQPWVREYVATNAAGGDAIARFAETGTVHWAAGADTARFADSVAKAFGYNAYSVYTYDGIARIDDRARAAAVTNAAQTAAIAELEESVAEVADNLDAFADIGAGWVANAAAAATNYTDSTVAPVASTVGALWTAFYGETAWFAVTNYLRTVAGVVPSLSVWEVRDGVTNCVYSSREEITNLCDAAIADCRADCSNRVDALAAAMPDAAWSRYQSATGAEAPEGVTCVTTPAVMLMGGYEWACFTDQTNAVWVLTSNGLTTLGAEESQYFRISDSAGAPQFEVRKTDSVIVGAVATNCWYADGTFYVDYPVNVAPTVSLSGDLKNWSEGTADGDYGVKVSVKGTTYPLHVYVWNVRDDCWRVEIAANDEPWIMPPQLFVKAEYTQEGGTKIINHAAVDVSGGILCTDGVHKCRPVYANGAITWEVVQ